MASSSADNRWSEVLRNVKKPLVPARLIIAILSLLSTGFAYAARADLSVAIVSMIPRITNSSNETHHNVTIDDKFYFNWTKPQEGIVLGAYYYGYTAANIVAGRLCERFNVVHLSFIAHIISIATTLLTPVSASLGIPGIFVVRFIQGISHGPILSALYVLFTRWFPKSELATVLGSIFVGANLGIALVMPFSAFLCKLSFWGGWPISFYALGLLNLLCIVIWWILVSPHPSSYRWISEYELKLIEREACSNEKRKICKVNWFELFSSKELWANTVAQGACGFGYMVVNTKIPAYLESLQVPLQDNGFINAFLFTTICITMLAAGRVSDWMVEKQILSVTNVRKLFETGTLLIPAICLLIIPWLGDDRNNIVVLLVVSMFGLGLMTGGETPMVSEMAPDLSGTVFGIVNTAASAGGFMAPLVIGLILDSQDQSSPRWDNVFYLTAAIMILGWVFFIIFASSKPQPWGIAPNRASSIVTVTSLEMPEMTRFRLWFETKKKRLSKVALIWKY